MFKNFVILCLTLAFHSQASAQFEVKNFYNLAGKKDVSINTIAQDKTGFLWLGAVDGVYLFDGRTATEIHKIYPTLKKEITAIYFDKQGRTWIGSKKGKVYFIFENKLDSLDFSQSNNDSKITSFIEIHDQLIISTYGNGIFIKRTNRFDHITTKNGLSDDVVYKVTGDGKSRIWCATDAGISEVNLTNPQPIIYLISNKTGLPDNIVRDVFYQNNTLTIAMQDSGVCFFDISNRKFNYNPFFKNWTLGAVINSQILDKQKLILATEKNGILIAKNSILTVIDYEPQINTTVVNHLFIDREQQIWLASKRGISQMVERRYHFISKKDGLPNNKILAVARDNNNSIWIGTSTGIFKLVKDEKNKTQIHPIKNLEKYSISCATKAPDGDIWFGTYGQGIIVFNTQTNNHVIINTSDDKIADNNVSHIYFSDNHTVYISTLGGGLIKATVDLEGEYKLFNIEKNYTQEDGLGSNYVYSAITDKQGKLYIATDGGGLQVLEKDKFIDLTKKFNFKSNTVFSLCKNKFGHIWAISNEDGIIRYDGRTLKKYNQQDGLRELQPQQIVCADNFLYAIHDRGIDKINCQSSYVSYYDFSFEEIEPNLNAILFEDNYIYSGTNSGLLTLRTGFDATDSIKPIVYFKGFELNYKPFPMDSIQEFKHNQNNLGFSFDGIWSKNPEKLKYHYKLIGFDADWKYSKEGEQVNYNNLSPGTYSFIVQAQNEEEIWSEAITFPFVIKTPIWKRWWFWLGVLTIVSFAVYAYVHYRVKSLEREKLILELKVKERTAQIEKQSKIIELKNTELEQLSLVASKTDNVVLILDPAGNLEYINESFIRLHQLSMEELILKYGRTIFELSNHANIRQLIGEAIQNKKSINYESLNKKVVSETEVWQSSTLTPIFDQHGELKKIIIIDTDVSDRKKQEQIIFQKNKDITDSISYARKIQHSILPQETLIKNFLPKSFIVYLTKDIVSGDFYWFSHINGSSIIAAVDCTGHGVPGAFMSLIGYNLLNKIVNEQKITKPGDILLALNNGVIDALYKNETESKDGMDIAICKINHRENTMEYAGAMRPLWVVKNNDLHEIKADKIPIGTKQKDRIEQIEYTTHLIALNQSESFYIFTDGYADQFGGSKEKKYSTGKFKELLMRLNTDTFTNQAESIKSEHITWKGNNEQVDDILILGFTA